MKRSKVIEGSVNVPHPTLRLDYKGVTVKGDFSCVRSLVTSLEGSPVRVEGGVYCGWTRIQSLHNVHKHIKYIGDDFYLPSTIKSHIMGIMLIGGVKKILFVPMTIILRQVEEIINRHLQGDRDVHACQEELLEAGLSEYAKV